VVFTDASFQSEVLESDKPVVVDFSATWCAPCRQLAPIIEELSKEYEGRVKIGKIDIDDNQEVAAQYGITAVPTVLYFKGGKKVDSQQGLHRKDVYRQKIESMLL
jgi:thioredoxin 1